MDEPKTSAVSSPSESVLSSDSNNSLVAPETPVLATPELDNGIPLSPPLPPVDNPQSGDTMRKKSTLPLIFLLLLGILGVVAFMILSKTQSASSAVPVVKQQIQSDKVTLPANVVKIQACADHKGTLYVEPQNIPVGPVYLVNKGEVIGIEYMLAKDEFLSGKSYKDLPGLHMKVDHVNIGLLSNGHEGYTIPHYHVDMYLVSKEIEESITCPASAQPTGAGSSSSASIDQSGVMPTGASSSALSK